jgi:uncharacterized protein (UPF0210 family)
MENYNNINDLYEKMLISLVNAEKKYIDNGKTDFDAGVYYGIKEMCEITEKYLSSIKGM